MPDDTEFYDCSPPSKAASSAATPEKQYRPRKLSKLEQLVDEQMLALLEWAADHPNRWHNIGNLEATLSGRVTHLGVPQATRQRSLERLVGAQRHPAASTNSHGPWGALESWAPFSEELVEAVIEDGATNLQQQIGAVRGPANGLARAHALFDRMTHAGLRRRG